MTVSPTLMQAILAMDAYNRGYNEGLTGLGGVGSQIGMATITQQSSITAGSEERDAGFYAVAYNYDGGTVISYRGTDNETTSTNSLSGGSDVINGWGTAVGLWRNDQIRLAAEFFEAVDATTDNIISLTGHSLGGGLAGLVGSIYGQAVTYFDNMPFELSSDRIHYHASLTDAQIEDKANAAATGLISFDQTVYDDTYNLLVESRTYARDTFYQGGPPKDQNRFLIDGYAVTGEALDAAWTRVGQGSPVEELDSFAAGSAYGLFGDLGPVQLHSQALLVNLLYAQENSHTDWHSIASSLWGAAFNDEVGKAAGFPKKNIDGHRSHADKMLTAIGYSAIDEGTRVFGDTGIKAMFDDADQLGKVSSGSTANSIFQRNFDVQQGGGTVNLSVSDAIAQIFVQYAGILANYKIEQGADTLNVDPEKGVLDLTSNEQLLSLDLSSILWNDVFNNAEPFKPIAGEINPINKDELFTQVFLQNGYLSVSDGGGSDISNTLSELGLAWNNEGTNEATFSSLAQLGWGTNDSSVLDRVNIATKNSGPEKTIGPRRYDTDLDKLTGDDVHVDVYAGVAQIDKIVGSEFNDLIFTGKGKDEITGSGGRDFISGGDGDDKIDYSSLDNNNDAIVITVDKASELGAANAPDKIALVEVLKNFSSLEALDILHSIETLVGTDNVDQLTVNDLPEDLKLKIQNLGGTANEDVTTIIDGSAVSGGIKIETDANGNGTIKAKNGKGGTIELENALVSGDASKTRVKLTNEDDILTGSLGTVTIEGGDGDDIISAMGLNNVVYGQGGDDEFIRAGAGSQIFTGEGADTVRISQHTFIADASVNDELFLGEQQLTGGIRWAHSESA